MEKVKKWGSMFDLKAVGNFLRSLPVVARLFTKRDYLPDDVYEKPRRDIEVIQRRLEMAQAILFKQKPEYDERGIVYHGWIRAFPEQRGLLEAMGVRIMEHNEVGGYFGCICGKAVMEALMLGFPTFWPSCFTACIGDEQLPHGLQEYWHYPNTLVGDGDVGDRKWKCPRCDAVINIERRRCGNCMAYRTYLESDFP